jgi:hypothetical protein
MSSGQCTQRLKFHTSIRPGTQPTQTRPNPQLAMRNHVCVCPSRTEHRRMLRPVPHHAFAGARTCGAARRQGGIPEFAAGAGRTGRAYPGGLPTHLIEILLVAADKLVPSAACQWATAAAPHRSGSAQRRTHAPSDTSHTHAHTRARARAHAHTNAHTHTTRRRANARAERHEPLGLGLKHPARKHVVVAHVRVPAPRGRARTRSRARAVRAVPCARSE